MSAVAVSTVTSMYDLAAEFLAAVVAAMATTDAGAPDRSYISLGEPVFDTLCAQAIVHVGGSTEGATGPSSPPEGLGLRHSRGRINLIAMTAWALRCVSIQDGQVPVTDAQFSADAKAGYEDGWAIWNYINRAIDSESLFGGACADVHMDGGLAITPSGGLGGWRFMIRAELSGYDPTA